MTMESNTSDENAPRFSVLIVAGGSGTRLGGDTPKQYQTLNGNTVLDHAIKTFRSCGGLKEIRLVCDSAHAKWYHDTVQRFALSSPAPSGNTRKNSVFNGLKSFPDLKDQDIILIHDAARPFITRQEIESLVKSVHNSGAATLAVPVSDTLRRGQDIIDRTDIQAIQTPQGFTYGLIRKAHEMFKDRDDFTDDAGMVAAMGHEVQIIAGKRGNFKITTSDDMEIAEKLMNTPQFEVRTGLGFDVHAFDGEKTGPIRLGGIDIPFDKALTGHSDADVGLHALTDALLASIAAGDIGLHFPPSDPQWKGADSAVFLKHALELVRKKRGVISLIDLTFLCETPKIGPVREEMQRHLSQLTALPVSRISIKASTTEKLGFTGRGEGIAAQALVTIRFPADSFPE